MLRVLKKLVKRGSYLNWLQATEQQSPCKQTTLSSNFHLIQPYANEILSFAKECCTTILLYKLTRAASGLVRNSRTSHLRD